MPDQLKIAYVCIDDAQDRHTFSGTNFHILEAMRNLQHKIHVVSPLNCRLKYLYALQKLWDRTFQPCRQPLMLRSFAAQVSRALRHKDVDLVVAPSSIPVAYLECPQPIIWWTDAVFESLIDYHMKVNRRNAKRGFEQERNSLQRAAHVVYSSDWSAEVARALYPEFSHKISVIPYGANLTEPPTSIPERVPQAPYKLLFLGVDWQGKGGSIALEATDILNRQGTPATLRVVGCDPPLGSDLQHVEPHGFISKRTPEGRATLHELLLSSDLFILPTRAESSAIVWCEASAYGLPIVSTDTGGVRNYVVNGSSGVTLPLEATPGQWASAVAGILGDSGRYRQMSFAARREYEMRLNWDVGVRRLLDLVGPHAGISPRS